jgi:DNA-binding HxlR family transcriptional regulator
MDTLSTYVLLTAAAFFVVLGFGLLYRYRQVSQRLTASTDLGHDLWSALEVRLNKQDERILDVMGRVEVIQSRVLQGQGSTRQEKDSSLKPVSPSSKGKADAQAGQNQPSESRDITSHQVASIGVDRAIDDRLSRQDIQIGDVVRRLDSIQSLLTDQGREKVAPPVRATEPVRHAASTVGPTERLLLDMLAEKPRTSVEIRQRFNVSREHSARLLKGLYDRGFVVRNDSNKPFVYELTEAGRSHLSAS